MCTACATIDTRQSEAFGERMIQTLVQSSLSLMLSIGHRTGLFDTMATMQRGGTSLEIARAANLQERYVREWLGSMVTADIVTYDPEEQRYHLPAEHAAMLTRAASPNNMAQMMQWFAVLGSVEDQIVDCFQSGGGVPYEAYRRFHDVMADESQQTTVMALKDAIIPLVPGLHEQLTEGMDMADIGCGRGRAMIELARLYPASRFVGYDFNASAIAAAREEASRQGVTNVRFEVQDAAKLSVRDGFDVITAFDAIHDQVDPARVLENIRKALRPGGVFLMQDIRMETPVEKNIGSPLAPFIYAISCMHCMTVSLSAGGAGLGAAWGRQLAEKMLREAGFTQIDRHELEHDIQNDYYLVRKD